MFVKHNRKPAKKEPFLYGVLENVFFAVEKRKELLWKQLF